MSIFSHIKKSRQQAKEHNAKLAEQKKRESAHLPYKHVPTHAAADAIACAPPSWREQTDRPRIVEQNRRRSAMAAAGYNMNMPGVPRVGSSLSHVSYPSGDATPVVQMPRAHSYNNMYSYQGNREVIYSMPGASMSQPTSWKGKDVYRGIYDTSSSSAPSKGEPSPDGSSSGSSSSHDELEIKPAPRPTKHSRPPTASTDAPPTAHRLHPSHRRNTSDSLDKIVMSSAPKAAVARDPRPPPSTRGFQYVPPSGHVQAPPASRAPAFYPPPSQASPGYYGDNVRRHSTMSTQQQADVSPRGAVANPSSQRDVGTPVSETNGASDYSLDGMSLPSPNLGFDMATEAATPRYAAPSARTNEQTRSQQLGQQPDLERIESGVEPSYFTLSHSRMSLQQRPPPLAHEDLVNVFPEPAVESTDSQKSPSKKNKLTKGGGKLSKKNRWSLSKSSGIVA